MRLSLSQSQTELRVLFPSGDEFNPYGEGFGGTVAPSGAILGASGGNGFGGAAGATLS